MELLLNIPLLYLTTAILNLFICFTIIYKGFWKKSGNILFLLFIISVLGWIAALYGIYVFAFQNLNSFYLTWAIKGAYASSLLMPFFLFKFFYHFPSQSFKLPRWLNLIVDAIPLILAGLCIFTSLIFIRPIIEDNKYLADELGPLFLFYTLYFVFIFLWAVFVGIHKIKNSRGIEVKKVVFASMSCWLFLVFPIITNAILPIWDIYIFQFEAPIFTFIFIIPTFYAITNYRFLDIKFTLRRILKVLIAAICSIIFAFLFEIFLHSLLPTTKLTYIHGIAFFTGFLAYPYFLKLFHSKLFQRFFGRTNTEYFIETINEFQKENPEYKTFEEFTRNIENIFCQKLHISYAKILLVDQITKQSYPHLIDYCNQNPKILVTKEIESFEKDQKKKFPFSDELKKLGQICLPLSGPSKTLLGFLLLGEKPFHIPYSSEEIAALEKMRFPLSLELSAILYNKELQKAVKEKTKELEKQNKEISNLLAEKIKLLAQQSDFLALTAHELRTPLSLAVLYASQLETYAPIQKTPEIQSDVDGLKRSLNKLRNLTDKLFQVLQLDLEKINITPEKTNINEFIERIYEDFQPLMKEKSLTFILQNKLKQNLIAYIDPVYLRQLLQNYLTNAIKFTPIGGKITLEAKETPTAFSFLVADNGEGVPDDSKQEIFKKFKSNHTMQSPGLGLGLYICQQIAKLHHGRVWVEDNPEGGSIFGVEIKKSQKKNVLKASLV